MSAGKIQESSVNLVTTYLSTWPKELCRTTETNKTVVGLTSFWRSLMYFKFVVNKAQTLSLLFEIAAFLKKKVVGEC